jgi:hypothetical protein
MLPLVIFLAVVGGLAWFTQYLPNWRERKVEGTDDGAKKEEVKGPGLVFVRNRAIWDVKEPDYVKEIEKGKDGFYDFPIINPSDNEVELGIFQVSCDCTQVLMALAKDKVAEEYVRKLTDDPTALEAHASWEWKSLQKDYVVGFPIPPQSQGILRLTWQGRKAAGEKLRLNIGLWAQPKGQTRLRALTGVEVPIIMAFPLQFSPPKVHVGTLTQDGQQQAEFTVWSVTRDALPLTFAQRPEDVCFQFELKPLPPEETSQLKERLKKEQENASRVRTAYRLVVTARESVADPKESGKLRQLDLGPFAYRVPLLLEGEPLPMDMPGPVVQGIVKGEIEVTGSEGQGKIDLKTFPAKQGTRRNVIIWSGPKTDLKLLSHSPQLLALKFTKKTAESTPARTKWLLEVVVPAEAAAGPFPEDSAIFLEVQGPQPRQIRIPILGSAVQG